MEISSNSVNLIRGCLGFPIPFHSIGFIFYIFSPFWKHSLKMYSQLLASRKLQYMGISIRNIVLTRMNFTSISPKKENNSTDMVDRCQQPNGSEFLFMLFPKRARLDTKPTN